MTREQWLTQFLQTVRPIFRSVGYPILPKIKVGTSHKPHFALVDGFWEISITDKVHTGIRAAESLISTLVWRCIQRNSTGFDCVAKLVGYTDGPEGKRLGPLLRAIVDEMPPYPGVHSREKWLKLFIHVMHPWFEAAGRRLPTIEVRLGQITPAALNHVSVITEDTCYVFISPTIGGTFTLAKLLTYEFAGFAEGLCGESVGIIHGCFTENLTQHLHTIIDRIGPYPEK